MQQTNSQTINPQTWLHLHVPKGMRWMYQVNEMEIMAYHPVELRTELLLGLGFIASILLLTGLFIPDVFTILLSLGIFCFLARILQIEQRLLQQVHEHLKTVESDS